MLFIIFIRIVSNWADVFSPSLLERMRIIAAMNSILVEMVLDEEVAADGTRYISGDAENIKSILDFRKMMKNKKEENIGGQTL